MQCDKSRVRNIAQLLQSDSSNLYSRLLDACQGIVDLQTLDTMSLDSRHTNKTAIFLAVTGTQVSGNDYIDDAYKRGCRFVLAHTSNKAEHLALSLHKRQAEKLVMLSVYNLRQQLGALSEAFYGELSHFTTVAITGTNGKTSVANLYAQMHSLVNAKSASIGTLGVNSSNKGQAHFVAPTINTTPDIVSLYTTYQELKKQQIHSVAIEASSHGLAQNRLASLPINTAIFTNLSQDHLDYHGDMQSYGAAKRKLLDAHGLQHIVLNADDPESLVWAEHAPESVEVFWYSLQQTHFANMQSSTSAQNIKGCWVSKVKFTKRGSEFTLHSSWGSAELTLGLIGEFNIANMLAAITALLAQKLSFNLIVNNINKLNTVAGRMELFANKNASILVDYAHTPDALKQALLAARLHTKNKLICVFGCGGDRDKAKRVIMGEIAYELADHVVLTQDNSRSETPMHIIDDILQGFASKQNVEIVLDREQAIAIAWQKSSENDMIVVAGKGHETYMEIAGKRILYNEREVVKKLIATTELPQHTLQNTSGEKS